MGLCWGRVQLRVRVFRSHSHGLISRSVSVTGGTDPKRKWKEKKKKKKKGEEKKILTVYGRSSLAGPLG